MKSCKLKGYSNSSLSRFGSRARAVLVAIYIQHQSQLVSGDPAVVRAADLPCCPDTLIRALTTLLLKHSRANPGQPCGEIFSEKTKTKGNTT